MQGYTYVVAWVVAADCWYVGILESGGRGCDDTGDSGWFLSGILGSGVSGDLFPDLI